MITPRSYTVMTLVILGLSTAFGVKVGDQLYAQKEDGNWDKAEVTAVTEDYCSYKFSDDETGASNVSNVQGYDDWSSWLTYMKPNCLNKPTKVDFELTAGLSIQPGKGIDALSKEDYDKETEQMRSQLETESTAKTRQNSPSLTLEDEMAAIQRQIKAMETVQETKDKLVDQEDSEGELPQSSPNTGDWTTAHERVKETTHHGARRLIDRLHLYETYYSSGAEGHPRLGY